MSDTIKPQVIPSVYQIYGQLRDKGLTEDDIIVLIQKRTRPRLGKTVIRNTLRALREIERDILKKTK